MNVRIKLNLPLQTLVGKEYVSVLGTTVRECLEDLIRMFPAAADHLFRRDGYIVVSILINNDPLPGQDLSHPVADNDELWLLSVVTGG